MPPAGASLWETGASFRAARQNLIHLFKLKWEGGKCESFFNSLAA